MLVKQWDLCIVQSGSGRRIRMERRENETTSLYIELPQGAGWVGIDFPTTNETQAVAEWLLHVGSVTFDADGLGAMGKPFTYDAGNVAEFAKIF